MGVLGADDDRRGDGVPVEVVDVVPVEREGAGLPGEQPGEGEQGGRLAGAGRSDDRDGPAGPQVEGELR